jgi:hypothetical protein
MQITTGSLVFAFFFPGETIDLPRANSFLECSNGLSQTVFEAIMAELSAILAPNPFLASIEFACFQGRRA